MYASAYLFSKREIEGGLRQPVCCWSVVGCKLLILSLDLVCLSTGQAAEV